MRQLFAGRIPDRRSIGLSLNTGRCALGGFSLRTHSRRRSSSAGSDLDDANVVEGVLSENQRVQEYYVKGKSYEKYQ